MRIARVKIKNFANFADRDVETGENIVIVGENKVGKSNFIRALQLERFLIMLHHSLRL